MMVHRLAGAVRCAAIGAAFVILQAAPSQAQALRLRATADSSATAVRTAVAEVLDDKGAVVVRAVLPSGAWRLLALPRAGQYRVRVRRVGFEPLIVAAPFVTGRDTMDFSVMLPSRRVTLSTITVRGRPVCTRNAFRDPSVSALWTEIGTALTTTLLDQTDSSLTLEARAFRRRLDSRFALEEERVGLPRLSRGASPYYALTADELASGGYVRQKGTETTYYAPDEAVLLSDRFAEEHCFQVTRGEGVTEGLLGLRFTPPARHDVNDIAGTLWVDSASSELRFLDFWYVSDAYPFAARGEGRSGGQVLFGRAGNGNWIVSAWRLRMPRFADGRSLSARSDPDWYEEVGGVVSSLASDTLLPLGIVMPYRDVLAPARVMGVVFDSISDRPLAGARVWLLPAESREDVEAGLVPNGGRPVLSSVSALADSGGRFVLADLPAGRWRLAFEHPTLDSVGVRAPFYDIRLRPGASVAGVLAVPSMSTLRAGCATPDGVRVESTRGMITGFVSAATDDRVLVGALVRASWVGLRRGTTLRTSARVITVETRTDSLGEYRICGAGDSTEVSVVAAGPHSRTGEVRTMIGRLDIARLNLRLAEVAEGEAAPAAGAVSGSVTDAAGAPVAGARVSLDGSSSTVLTDSAGMFVLANVQPGTQTLEVRQAGLEPARLVLDIAPGSTTPVALTLAKSHLLYAIRVTAPRNNTMQGVADAITRQRYGVGRLLLEEQMKGAATFESLLQNVSGLRVVPDENGGPWVALMHRGVMGECVARPFLDGHEVDYDVVATLKPSDIAALEVFVRGATAPIFTAGPSIFGRDRRCGVILIWEKHQV